MGDVSKLAQCNDCKENFNRRRVRNYIFTDEDSNWVYWTVLCRRCERAQWKLYSGLEPKPEPMYSYGPNVWQEFQEQNVGFCRWVKEQFHPR